MARHEHAMPSMRKTKEHLYNAQGAPEAGEAMDETPGFKRGGKAKKRRHRRHGGKVEGHKAKHRADRHEHRAHGGRSHKHMEEEREKEREERHHRKHGGKAHMMEMEEHRHHRAKGGRTPYSSGSMTTEPTEAGKTNRGHESERPAGP